MDENIQRQPNPRRRRKTKLEIFKEAYLPTIILGVTVVLILVFIIGSVSRNNAMKKPPVQQDVPTTESVPSQLELEVQQLLKDAEVLALSYNFQGAVELLNGFQGDISAFPELAAKIDEYTLQASQTVAWSDPSQILNLSFHGLIQDTKAFADKQYGKSYNRNFITTAEFRKILDGLYENGYVLVDLEDITACETDTAGQTVCSAKTLYLPLGKKPLLLTQTNLNYYTYMVDGNGDGEPDKDGAGFASRLMVDADGNLTCEMVNSQGQTVTGDFDLVPILESFIAEHPDFSYQGARAILAVSGYDGIFGYRTTAAAKKAKGETYYNEQVQGATELVAALKDKGYTLACYTYGNNAYGKVSASEIQADLNNWKAEVTPILGETDILVFAQNSDIGTYSGGKFNVLQNSGFRYYLGFAANRTGGEIGSNYIVHNRLLVTGSQIAHSPALFNGLFDTTSILDTQRGNVPK